LLLPFFAESERDKKILVKIKNNVVPFPSFSSQIFSAAATPICSKFGRNVACLLPEAEKNPRVIFEKLNIKIRSRKPKR